MKYHDVGEIRRRRLQHAGRRAIAVNLTVAFVAEHQKAEPPRQCGEFRQIIAIGHRALRIRRRCEVERDRARQKLLAERIEIRKKAGVRGRRQIDRLAAGRQRAGRIRGVERVGNEHRGRAGARLNPALRGNRRKKQPLACAVEHQHFGCRIDRAFEPVARRQPFRNRLAKGVETPVHRIAAEIGDVLRDHRADEGRDRVLRLADRHADGRLARRNVAEQLAEPHER